MAVIKLSEGRLFLEDDDRNWGLGIQNSMGGDEKPLIKRAICLAALHSRRFWKELLSLVSTAVLFPFSVSVTVAR